MRAGSIDLNSDVYFVSINFGCAGKTIEKRSCMLLNSTYSWALGDIANPNIQIPSPKITVRMAVLSTAADRRRDQHPDRRPVLVLVLVPVQAEARRRVPSAASGSRCDRASGSGCRC